MGVPPNEDPFLILSVCSYLYGDRHLSDTAVRQRGIGDRRRSSRDRRAGAHLGEGSPGAPRSRSYGLSGPGRRCTARPWFRSARRRGQSAGRRGYVVLYRFEHKKFLGARHPDSRRGGPPRSRGPGGEVPAPVRARRQRGNPHPDPARPSIPPLGSRPSCDHTGRGLHRSIRRRSLLSAARRDRADRRVSLLQRALHTCRAG